MGDGETLLSHLIFARDKFGREDDRLKLEEIPVCAAEVWNAFQRLDERAREYTDFGARMPLRYEAIDAYMKVTGHDLEPWEIEAIESMDVTFLNLIAESNKNNG